MNGINKVKAYLKRYGVVKLCHKAIESRMNFNSYNIERLSEIITEEEIEEQKKHIFDRKPIISIVVYVKTSPFVNAAFTV